MEFLWKTKFKYIKEDELLLPMLSEIALIKKDCHLCDKPAVL